MTYVFMAPVIISSLSPPVASSSLLRSKLMGNMCTYFKYQEILETPDDELMKLVGQRSMVAVLMPHGVISYGGICSACYPLRDETLMPNFPTAVASVVMQLPILKHVMGVFGLLNASKKSLTKHMQQGKSFVLYTGGIAELFLCSKTEEKLFLKNRKGFIKLALRNNADVTPTLLFGNTEVLDVLKNDFLQKLSRSAQVTMTWFWGLWGLPVPLPKQIVYVRGRPLGLPHIEEPTDEDVDKWHTKFCLEVQRLFETHKADTDYNHKTLTII